MARWTPNPRGRLEQAALELYRERGFEQTPVADIAARAGLTERTFFRHFLDKREVLFGGSRALQDLLVQGVASAPVDLAPLEAVVRALEASGAFFSAERRAHSRQRQRIIEANVELQERELIKLASLSAALTGVLRERAIPDPAAGLAADAGMAVFKAAFARWLEDSPAQDTPAREFSVLVREALEALKGVMDRP